jgi:hypothetical protein
MRRKYLFIKIAGFLSLIILLFTYFLLYFIPALKSINRYKRRLKDMNLKISDFVRMESAFSFSNEQERSYIERTDQELRGKIPEVRTREDYITLFTKISNYIQTLAEKDGILTLVMKSDSQELSINTGTFSTNKSTLDDLSNFTGRRLIRLLEEQNRVSEGQKGVMGKRFSARLKNAKSHTITLSFTGEIKNAVNFINHIPWSDYYLSEDRILVSAGYNFPYYIVFLKIYYIELREQTASVVKGSEKKQEGLIIDYNSEVLLNRIDPELTEPFPKKKLPSKFGIKIFSKKNLITKDQQ